MISIYKNDDMSATGGLQSKAIELRGLSTDEKPTTIDGSDMENGATFIEIDTGKIFFFDGENEQWKEI